MSNKIHLTEEIRGYLDFIWHFISLTKTLKLIFLLKREDKYLASLGIDNKLIFFHIWETKVDYFVEREIKLQIAT